MEVGQIPVIQFAVERDASGNRDRFPAEGRKAPQLHPAQAFQPWRRDGKKIALSGRDISFDAFFKRRRQNTFYSNAGIVFDKELLILIFYEKNSESAPAGDSRLRILEHK
jgi:hypothetical protein